jgi:hypothetical protein
MHWYSQKVSDSFMDAVMGQALPVLNRSPLSSGWQESMSNKGNGND